MPDVKEVVNRLEMSYKYSNVDENSTLVPQWVVLHAIELLREQEPVEPTLSQKEIDFRSEIVDVHLCGSCKYELDSGWQYCPICGRKVKWDD